MSGPVICMSYLSLKRALMIKLWLGIFYLPGFLFAINTILRVLFSVNTCDMQETAISYFCLTARSHPSWVPLAWSHLVLSSLVPAELMTPLAPQTQGVCSTLPFVPHLSSDDLSWQGNCTHPCAPGQENAVGIFLIPQQSWRQHLVYQTAMAPSRLRPRPVYANAANHRSPLAPCRAPLLLQQIPPVGIFSRCVAWAGPPLLLAVPIALSMFFTKDAFKQVLQTGRTTGNIFSGSEKN